MKTVSLGLALAVIVSGLGACSDPAGPANQNPEIVQIGVNRLDAPATVALGAPIDVVLNVEIGGCTSFDHITAVRGGSEINLSAWGKVFTPPNNGFCMAYLLHEQHSIRLEPPFPTKFTIIVQPITFGVLLTRDVTVQ
jgi:hypothetical protein